MLEQETASIFKFVIEAAGSPTPYYREVPENFHVPAAFFPIPEISSFGDTFETYGADYDWYIKFFACDTNEAYSMALNAFTGIKRARNLVPLLNEDGTNTESWIRLKDPEIKQIDAGVVQLIIRFTSRKPYTQQEYEKMKNYTFGLHIKEA